MTIFEVVSPEVAAAIIAAGGAIVVKSIEKWITNQPKSTATDAHKLEIAALRNEIDKTHQLEINTLREDLERANRTADKWQKKYWESRAATDSDEHRITELTDTVRTLHTKLEALINNETIDEE